MSETSQHTASAEPAPVRERLLRIPELCLVALIGASGSGKSTFAAHHFLPTEVLSSDHYRGVVADDPNDLAATTAAFHSLYHIALLRLRLGRLTVVDATNVKPQDRAELIRVAREHDVLAVAIVLNLDERVCRERNAARPDRQFGPHVVRTHISALRRNLRGLEREGFRHVDILNSPESVDSARVERTPLWTNRRAESGPFDIVGDVHGCYEELCELLARLGYRADDEAGMRHPDGRWVIFLGDLVDRGPKVVETVRLVRRMVAGGTALCVPGNHDIKLQRHLTGRQGPISPRLADSISQIDALPQDERTAWIHDFCAFADALVSHYELDDGKLVVAHAGMKAAHQGRSSSRVRDFALFGETTGESDDFGLPIRTDWAADYRGKSAVVFGHTPVPQAHWLNNTINIDTGCVFGGQLSALRWPERELVSVPAHQPYTRPARPLSPVPPAPNPPPPPLPTAKVDPLLPI